MFSAESYWEHRYRNGMTSGDGSYGHLAEFKATTLNCFIKKNLVNTVIDFGCGDGNNVSLLKVNSYYGFDISPSAVKLCKKKFANDKSKFFYNMNEYKGQIAEMAISLDVIFHLVEDNIFDNYMETLFNASNKYIVIYSSNYDMQIKNILHVRHRKFSDWILKRYPNWHLIDKISNKFPATMNNESGRSFSNFYFYQLI